MPVDDIPPPSDADAPWLGRSDSPGNGHGQVLPFRQRTADRVAGHHLPHHLDAEASILGGILLRPDVMQLLPSSFGTDAFYDPRHKSVFGAMRNLEARSVPIDLVTLEAELSKIGKLDSLGGPGFLGELALRVPTIDNVASYASIVLAHSATRAAMLTASAAVGEMQRGSLGSREAIEELVGGLRRILDEHAPPAPAHEPGSDAWFFTKALADVKAALSLGTADGIQLMFEPAINLFTCDYPATSWLVRGLIVEGGVTVVGGIPKEAFKTWFLIETAVAVATGTPMFGEFETGPPKTVVYFFAEDLKRSVRNRIRASAAGRGMSFADATRNLHVQPRGRFLDVLRDEDMALVVASCRKIGKVDLLILEPLRDLHSGEEDSSDSMREVMRRIRLLGELLGCTPAVAHHSGKGGADTKGRGGGQRLRGSGSIHGSIDNGIYLDGASGDGESVFRNRVESQVKGAKSAGFFDLGLTIEDDTQGEAIRATWRFERVGKGQPGSKSRPSDDEIELVLKLVRTLAIRGEQHSRRGLRDHDERPVTERKMTSALDLLIEKGRLVLEGPKVVLPSNYLKGR